MEVDEVVRRVGLAYWPLILGLVLVGVAGAAYFHHSDVPVYTSDVRFVLDAPDPRAAAESVSIADTAKSIATSLSNVSGALSSAGVSRNVEQFAVRNIDLQPLGTSGIMDLQVKDTDPVAAAAIANTLADDVVKTRASVNQSKADQLTASLIAQSKAVDASIAQLDARIARYRAGRDPSVSAASLSGLYSERTSLAQEHLTLASEINQINQSLALRPQAGIIDGARSASTPDPSRAPIDIALGSLAGLVLGVILAALFATLRPQISGRREIARALEGPVLGDFSTLVAASDTSLKARIRMAAIRAGVKYVHLVPLDGSDEAVSLVNVLAERLGSRPKIASGPVPLHSNGQAVAPAAPTRKTQSHQLTVMRFDPAVLSKNGNSSETGLILVTPDVLDRKDLDATADLLSLTGCAVAGVVTYGRKSGWSRAAETSGRYVVIGSRDAHPDGILNPLGYL
jgi:capsular polysaccharide biosynthesis protein